MKEERYLANVSSFSSLLELPVGTKRLRQL